MINVERIRVARGEEASRLSLAKMCIKIREGRLNPWVRAYAMKKIVEAGSPDGEDARARAIYEAVVREKIYVPDPIDAELIAGAACTLADCDGLAFEGGDCDDQVVAFFAAVMSVGIRAYICGQAVTLPRRPTQPLDHVSGGVWLRHEKQLRRCDPAKKLPYGRSFPSGRDLWIDPMSGMDLCEGPVCDISQWRSAPMSSHGDFIGVGAGPEDDISRVISCGGIDGFSCPAEPAMGPGSPQGGMNGKWHRPPAVGLAEGIVEPAKKIPGLDRFVRDIQVELLQKQGGLAAKWQEVVYAYNLMLATRKLIGKQQLDPVSAVATSDPKDLWTDAQEAGLRNLQPTVGLASRYLGDGASGTRPVDRVNGDAVVLVDAAEPQIVRTPTGDVAVVNPSGPGSPTSVVPSGFFAFEPILTTIIVVGVAAAVVVSIMSICDAVKAQTARARSKDLQDQQRYLTEKGWTPDQVNAAMAQLAETSQRIASGEASSKSEDPLAQFGKAAKFAAISAGVIGVAVGGAYLINSITSIRRGAAQAA